MPYIKKKRRRMLDAGDLPDTEGELNYYITTIIVDFLRRKGKSYKEMSAVRGVLRDVGDEFYRRVMAPYEDEKMRENGDVY